MRGRRVIPVGKLRQEVAGAVVRPTQLRSALDDGKQLNGIRPDPRERRT
jgi:hypothetical protein